MLLPDVCNSALQECAKASSLISNTNEFYSNHISCNGMVYSDQIHSSVIDSAFLMVFMALERFLECSFICYMMGQQGLNGNSFAKYVAPPTEDRAVDILKGTNRFADFTNRDTIIKLANNFFNGGGPYSYLNSISSDFEDMKKIRNAISHVSIESEQSFKGLVRTRLGSLPPNISTSIFLNTTLPSSSSTFFVHYKDTVINAINNISNPI